MKRFDARQACGFVDKAEAFPTTPQAQQQQQKRSIHVLHKAVNSVCYRHIAKNWIDIHRLSSGQSKRIAATRSALARFAAQVGDVLVVMEASGGYERPLMEALAEAGVRFARDNPRQAREFARATGRLAEYTADGAPIGKNQMAA